MRKRGTILFAVLFCLVLLTGCGCQHEWNEATCTEPKVCSKCGEVEGEPAGHRWESATCTAPETCTACGETKGEVLAHTFGEWQIVNETEMEHICETCGKTETAPAEKETLIMALLKGSNWIDASGNFMYNVNLGQDGRFYMQVIDERISGTWEYAGAQLEETSEGYHILATSENDNGQIHFVLTNAVGDGDSYSLVCQAGSGYLICEQYQFPDIVGTWEPENPEWIRERGEEVPPTLVISEDNTAVLQTETESYSGTVEVCDDSFADTQCGGLNNRAYCISPEGYDPVYLLLSSDGWNWLYMPTDGSTTRYVKVG